MNTFAANRELLCEDATDVPKFDVLRRYRNPRYRSFLETYANCEAYSYAGIDLTPYMVLRNLQRDLVNYWLNGMKNLAPGEVFDVEDWSDATIWEGGTLIAAMKARNVQGGEPELDCWLFFVEDDAHEPGRLWDGTDGG